MLNHFLVRLYFVLLSLEPYLLMLAKTDYPSILLVFIEFSKTGIKNGKYLYTSTEFRAI